MAEIGIAPLTGTPMLVANPTTGLTTLLKGDGNGNLLSPPLPSNATAINGSSGNVAAASAVATLAAAASKTTYITGFEVTGSGATAASVQSVVVAGVISGSMTYTISVPAGVTVGMQPLLVQFAYPVPANAVNTAITVTVPSLGAGNTNSTVNAHGFQI